MKILRKERGITLIALVITIIVLLILAAVTLNLVLGDNGIITKANQAKEITTESQVKEEIERKILEYRTIHNGDFDVVKFFEDNDNILGDTFTKANDNAGYSLSMDNYTFYVNNNGNTHGLFKFTIDNNEYYAVEGMTWEDWITNSKYNTNNLDWDIYDIDWDTGDTIYYTIHYKSGDTYIKVQSSDLVSADKSYSYIETDPGYVDF